MGSAWISFEARMANSSLDSAGRVTAKQKAGAVFDPIPRRLNLIMIRSYVAHMSLGKFVWTGRFQTWMSIFMHQVNRNSQFGVGIFTSTFSISVSEPEPLLL